MLFVTKKWQGLMDYIERLEMRYDDEIHNRCMSIHQSAMNNLKGKTLNNLLYECEKDKLLFKAKVDTVKEIRKYVDSI